MLNNHSNNIIYKIFSVLPNEKKEVILSDSTEGDIHFYFSIEHSRESLTTINVTSSHTADVIISSGAFQHTISIAPIRIGTYKGCNELYLEYEVQPINNLGMHEVRVSFILKRS